MKKLILSTVIVVALTMSGCEAIFGSPVTPTPQATYTPAPTYTPLPTYTPPPSPTEPPLPTATLVPLESPTGEVFGVTPTAGGGGGGLQATVLNFSYVREGPGLFYKPLTHVESGESVLVLGRDHDGFWLKIRNGAGREGWVKLTQFVQPIDIRQIAEVSDIPTPSITVTVKATAAATRPAITGTPGTPTPGTQAPVSTSSGGSGLTFNLTRGGGQQCLLVNPWYVNPAVSFAPAQLQQGIAPYKPGETTTPGTTVYQLDTSALHSGLSVTIQGNILPNTCSNMCNLITFTICASASASAAPGKYTDPLYLKFGPYDPVSFNASITSGIQPVLNVN